MTKFSFGPLFSVFLLSCFFFFFECCTHVSVHLLGIEIKVAKFFFLFKYEIKMRNIRKYGKTFFNRFVVFTEHEDWRYHKILKHIYTLRSVAHNSYSKMSFWMKFEVEICIWHFWFYRSGIMMMMIFFFVALVLFIHCRRLNSISKFFKQDSKQPHSMKFICSAIEKKTHERYQQRYNTFSVMNLQAWFPCE